MTSIKRGLWGGNVIDIEFRIVSDSREGLLLQLGRAVAAHGFTLQRPRMARIDNGVMLIVIARGPEANVLALQDKLGSHPMVHSFEASEPNASLGDTAVAPVPTPLRAQPPSPPRPAADASAGLADKSLIEPLLGAIVSAYPNMLDRLTAFERTLPANQREPTMLHIGGRLGAWIYKRDFALGARLALPETIRNIALPGVRQILRGAEMSGDSIRIPNSPFCGLGMHRGHSCHFLVGCLQGLLNESDHLGRVHVTETLCRNSGSAACSFSAAV